MELAFNNTGLLGDYDYADINHKKYDKKSSYRFLGIIGIIILIIVGINVLSCIGGGIAAACNSCSNCGSSSSSSGCSSCEKTTKEQYTIITNVGKTYTITKYKYSSCSNSYTDYSDDARLSSEYYTLEGYYKDEAMTKAIDKSDMKDGNTYYAKYSEKGLNDLYVIIFDCDYTMPQVDNVEVRVGENVNIYIDVEAFKAYDSTFKGFADPNGNIIIDSYGYLSKEYQEFHLYNWTFANTSYRTVHLTPKFQARYTIKFDMSGTGLSQLPSITIKDGESIKLNFTSVDVKRKGYAFQGFYDYNGNKIINSDLSIDYSYRTFYASYFSYDSNNNITLYPRYEEITYNLTINYEYDYYSNNLSYSFKEGDSLKKVVDSFIKEYFDNSEYYLDYVCLSGYYPQYAITEEVLKETLAETVSNVYLEFGKYSYINCVIPGQEMQRIKYKKNSSVAASLPEAPEMSGWEFVGWYSNAEYTNPIDTPEQLLNYDKIYAKYSYNPGGAVNNKINYYYDLEEYYSAGTQNYVPSFTGISLYNQARLDSTNMLGYTLTGWRLFRVKSDATEEEILSADGTPFTELPPMETGEINAVAVLQGDIEYAMSAAKAINDKNMQIGDMKSQVSCIFNYGSTPTFTIPQFKDSYNQNKYQFVGYMFNGKMITDENGVALAPLDYKGFGFSSYNAFAAKIAGAEFDVVFKVRTYTVTIVVGNRQFEVSDVEYGNPPIIDEAETITKEIPVYEYVSGYSKNPQTSTNTSKMQLNSFAITEDTTLYVHTAKRKIKITFVSEDPSLTLGFENPTMDVTYGYDGGFTKPNYTMQPNYDFVGYYYKDGNMAEKLIYSWNGNFGIMEAAIDSEGLNADFETIKNGITLYARSTKRTFTIHVAGVLSETYKVSKTIYYDDLLDEQTLLGTNTIPNKVGYDYDCWYYYDTDTPSEGSAYNFSTPVTANITLFPHYNPKQYNITLQFENSDNPEIQALKYDVENSISTRVNLLPYGETFVLPTPLYTNVKYEFKGYYLNGKEITKDGVGILTLDFFKNKTSNQSLTIDMFDNMVLEARYEAKIYTITLHNSNDSGAINSDHRIEYGGILSPNDLKSYVEENRPGNWYFMGWYYYDNQAKKFDFSQEIVENVELYAKYGYSYNIELYDDLSDTTPIVITLVTLTDGIPSDQKYKVGNDSYKNAINGQWAIMGGTLVNVDHNLLFGCYGVLKLYKK